MARNSKMISSNITNTTAKIDPERGLTQSQQWERRMAILILRLACGQLTALLADGLSIGPLSVKAEVENRLDTEW